MRRRLTCWSQLTTMASRVRAMTGNELLLSGLQLTVLAVCRLLEGAVVPTSEWPQPGTPAFVALPARWP